jgi:hypothetical protein
MQSARRMVKMGVQRGRSKVRDAKNNERHACGRRRGGEPAVPEGEAHSFLPACPEPAETGSFPGSVR